MHLPTLSYGALTLAIRALQPVQSAKYCWPASQQEHIASTREPLDGFPRFLDMHMRSTSKPIIRTHVIKISHGTPAECASLIWHLPAAVAYPLRMAGPSTSAFYTFTHTYITIYLM